MSRSSMHNCLDTATDTCGNTPAHVLAHTGRRFRQRLLVGLIGASLTAGAIALPGTSWAQSVNASLRGEAPANTEITALNVATGVTRHTRSEADGSYALYGLVPGTYSISSGPGTQQTVTLAVSANVVLDLTAPPVTPEQTINATDLAGVTVVANALPVVKTSQVATLVSQHQIETLPQVSRNFLEFADIVPGMAFTVNSEGNTSLRGGAGDNSLINVFIDGVSQKAYVMGGGVAGQNASQGNPFPQLAIGQYKVITSNYKAEYSQVGSAAITAVTKSGTNEFHGEVFYRYTDDGLRETTPSEEDEGEKTASEEKEYGFAFSGPIIEDRMHFFVTYEAKRFTTPRVISPSVNGEPGVEFLPPDVAALFGPANINFEEDLYFAKLDWSPTDNDRFELSARIRDEHGTAQIGGTNAPGHGLDDDNSDNRYVLKWDRITGLGFNELMLTHQETFFNPTPLTIGNGIIYQWDTGTGTPVIIQTGGASPLAFQNKGQEGWTLKDDFTLNPFDWHGEHIVKAGFSYRDLTLTAADAADINPQFSYTVTPDGVSDIPYKVFFTKPVTGLGLTPKVVTDDTQYGFYIQDDWAVNDHLLLNLGIRWDYEDNSSYTDFVTPQNVIDALNSPYPYDGGAGGLTYAEVLASGPPGVGYDINDYISTGSNRENFKDAWQPRLGFSYDIFADREHVIHGGIGRSYDRNLYNYLQLETTKAALPQFTIFFRDPVTGECRDGAEPCYDFDPAFLNGLENLQALLEASNVGAEVDMLNNNLKPPHTDMVSLGMTNQLGDWLTDVTLVHKLYKDGFAFTLGNRHVDGSFFKDHSQPWGRGVPGFGGLIIGNNGIEVKSNELLVSAKKAFTYESSWGATIAYTYTDATQNRDIGEHYAFDYAYVDNYPFILSNAAPEHRLVATGSLAGPWGLMFGGKLTLETPTPWNGIGCYGPNSPYAGAGNAPITFPHGSYCHAEAATPDETFGFQSVDLQVTKNFDIGFGNMYARIDVLNVFDHENLVGISIDRVGGPDNVVATYRPNGPITYVPRTIKVEVGMEF